MNRLVVRSLRRKLAFLAFIASIGFLAFLLHVALGMPAKSAAKVTLVAIVVVYVLASIIITKCRKYCFY